MSNEKLARDAELAAGRMPHDERNEVRDLLYKFSAALRQADEEIAELRMRHKPIRYQSAVPTAEQCKDARQGIYHIGDCILVWVNESDFWWSGLPEEYAPPAEGDGK